MQLQSIAIENYRSIKNTTLAIKEIAGKSCFILLGINESGKNNILKAITLKDNQSIDYSIDCEKDAEQSNENISITYKLFTGSGWDKIRQAIKSFQHHKSGI